MSLDPSKLPSKYGPPIPGMPVIPPDVRQSLIDRAGRIDRKPFVVSVGVLFGTAMLSVIARFAYRIFGRRKVRMDDAFVLFATLCLIVAWGICLRELGLLYLVEAINKKVIIPYREELPELMDLLMWSTVFAAMNWTAVYMVKFAFMYFFHTLIRGLSVRIARFYWTCLGIMIVFWLYTVVNPIVICPHFGSQTALCSKNPNQHTRSLTGNILVAVFDIITDFMIIAVPVIVLNKSMMPLSQKVSLAAMLCLSIIMVVCALIRLGGSITDTRPDGSGTAPIWATYWAIVEGCVALIMASVIVFRGVFISTIIQDDRQKQESILQRFGRRLMSTLRLSGSSTRSSRRSPQRSGYESAHDERGGPSAPKIATQGLTRGTMNGMKTFISGGKKRDDTLKSVDTAIIMEDLDYHNIRKNEATKPTATPESTNPGSTTYQASHGSHPH